MVRKLKKESASHVFEVLCQSLPRGPEENQKEPSQNSEIPRRVPNSDFQDWKDNW